MTEKTAKVIKEKIHAMPRCAFSAWIYGQGKDIRSSSTLCGVSGYSRFRVVSDGRRVTCKRCKRKLATQK